MSGCVSCHSATLRTVARLTRYQAIERTGMVKSRSSEKRSEHEYTCWRGASIPTDLGSGSLLNQSTEQTGRVVAAAFLDVHDDSRQQDLTRVAGPIV